MAGLQQGVAASLRYLADVSMPSSSLRSASLDKRLMGFIIWSSREKSMSSLDRCLNVYDLRAAAKRRLPRAVFEFVDRGSEDGVAVANNRNAFERIKLRHR